MKDEIAKTVNDRVIATYKGFNEILWIIKDNCDEDEFKRFRRIFGRVMGAIAFDILEVIYKEHPHLRPPELTAPHCPPPE